MFSPNAEVGACPSCRGLGHLLACDPDRLITDPSKPLAGGAMDGHKTGRFYGDPHGQHMATLAAAAARAGRGRDRRVGRPRRSGEGPGAPAVTAAGRSRSSGVTGAGPGPARTASRRPGPACSNSCAGSTSASTPTRAARRWRPSCTRSPARPAAAAASSRSSWRFASPAGTSTNCSACRSPTALASSPRWTTARRRLDDRVARVSADLRADIVRRLTSLVDAGLAYLSLDRPASTLSGGEAQRVRLAAQLRSGLTGITYVLDEPTIGLHPRDTQRLLGAAGRAPRRGQHRRRRRARPGRHRRRRSRHRDRPRRRACRRHAWWPQARRPG